MDPSRETLTAQRAARALKEAAVAAGGVGTDIDPNVGLALDADAEPAAFYRLDSLPQDALGSCRALIWSGATRVYLIADTYMSRSVEGLTKLTDDETITANDLPRLFRARDPRVFEAISVITLARDVESCQTCIFPFRYGDGAVEWLDREPDDADPDDIDGNTEAVNSKLVELFRLSWQLQDERPAEVTPLDVLQCGYTCQLDTLIPNADGGFDAHPFAERAKQRSGDARVHAFTLDLSS